MNITTKTGAVVTFTDPDARRSPSWTQARARTEAASASDGDLARLDEYLTGIWYDAESAGDTEAADRLFDCCEATLDEKINRDYRENQTPGDVANLERLARKFLDSV